MAYNIITGAKALIKINSKVAGFATGIQITESTFNGRVDSLGFIDTREVVPIGRAVSASVNFLRIFNHSNISEFDQLESEQIDEGEITNTSVNEATDERQRTINALLQDPFTLEVFDSAPSNVAGQQEQKIYKLEGCRISSQNFIVDRGSIAGVQVTIDATHLVRLDRRS